MFHPPKPVIKPWTVGQHENMYSKNVKNDVLQNPKKNILCLGMGIRAAKANRVICRGNSTHRFASVVMNPEASLTYLRGGGTCLRTTIHLVQHQAITKKNTQAR